MAIEHAVPADSEWHALSRESRFWGEDLGAHVASLVPGDHLCLVYDNIEEQARPIAPYFKAGLDRGERCLYIADDRTSTEIAQALVSEGMDVDREVRRGALVFLTKREAYLRTGRFTPEGQIEFWHEAIGQAERLGFKAIRIAAEMTWSLGPEPGCERIMEYEALLNQVFPGSRALAICQFNRRRFSPAAIEHVLTNHPVAVIGPKLYPNLFYQPTEISLGKAPEGARLDWMIEQLERAKAAEEARARLARAETEAESLAQVRLQASILSNVRDAVAVTDEQGLVRYWNQAATDVFGYAEAEVMGKRMDLLADWAGPESGRRRGIQGGWELREYQARRKDGSAITVETRVAPFLDGTAAAGDIYILRDVTERRQLEESVMQLSTPVLELEPQLLLLPLIGRINLARAQQIREHLSDRIRRLKAKVVIIDVTGVAQIREEAEAEMSEALKDARRLGAAVLLTGVRTAVSKMLMEAPVDLRILWTGTDLHSAVDEARRLRRAQ